MSYYNFFLRFIFTVKLVFILLAIYEIYITKKEPKNMKKINEIKYFKERSEILFKGLMSILLIYLFNPIYNKKNLVYLDYETRLFLSLFGMIIIITADWKTIIRNIPKSFKMLQEIL